MGSDAGGDDFERPDRHGAFAAADFLAATLYFSAESTPVQVEVLRSYGARIKGSRLPPVGTQVILRRGRLEAKGSIVWSAEDWAGLSFQPRIYQPAWFPPDGSPQLQVDRLARKLKQSGPDSGSGDNEKCRTKDEIIRDLLVLRQGLKSLGDQLANDIIMMATHPELQFIDEAMQRIERLVQNVSALEMKA